MWQTQEWDCLEKLRVWDFLWCCVSRVPDFQKYISVANTFSEPPTDTACGHTVFSKPRKIIRNVPRGAGRALSLPQGSGAGWGRAPPPACSWSPVMNSQRLGGAGQAPSRVLQREGERGHEWGCGQGRAGQGEPRPASPQGSGSGPRPRPPGQNGPGQHRAGRDAPPDWLPPAARYWKPRADWPGGGPGGVKLSPWQPPPPRSARGAVTGGGAGPGRRGLRGGCGRAARGAPLAPCGPSPAPSGPSPPRRARQEGGGSGLRRLATRWVRDRGARGGPGSAGAGGSPSAPLRGVAAGPLGGALPPGIQALGSEARPGRAAPEPAGLGGGRAGAGLAQQKRLGHPWALLRGAESSGGPGGMESNRLGLAWKRVLLEFLPVVMRRAF